MPSAKALAAFILAAAGATAAGHFYPPIRLFGIAVTGRAAGCPMRNVLAASGNLQSQIEWKDRILHASKLVENDPAGYHLIDTPRGRWWIPAGDDFVLPFNLAEQTRDIYGGNGNAVRPGDVVLDCGANVGVWTRTALDRGAKLVVAFEPAPENIESYRRNYDEELASGRVVLIPKGVWDKEDVLVLSRDPRNSAADTFVMTLKEGSRDVQAPLTTIDQVVSELELDRVDFIKMDVEGAETRALAGARNTIRRFHPRMSIAAEHLPTDAVAIPAAVRAAWPGYAVKCGPCMEAKDGHVRPESLFFSLRD